MAAPMPRLAPVTIAAPLSLTAVVIRPTPVSCLASQQNARLTVTDDLCPAVPGFVRSGYRDSAQPVGAIAPVFPPMLAECSPLTDRNQPAAGRFRKGPGA